MEELLLRFHHIGLQIFESLNYQNITKCREVNKLWKKFIDKEDILRFQLFMHLVTKAKWSLLYDHASQKH